MRISMVQKLMVISVLAALGSLPLSSRQQPVVPQQVAPASQLSNAQQAAQPNLVEYFRSTEGQLATLNMKVKQLQDRVTALEGSPKFAIHHITHNRLFIVQDVKDSAPVLIPDGQIQVLLSKPSIVFVIWNGQVCSASDGNALVGANLRIKLFIDNALVNEHFQRTTYTSETFLQLFFPSYLKDDGRFPGTGGSHIFEIKASNDNKDFAAYVGGYDFYVITTDI